MFRLQNNKCLLALAFLAFALSSTHAQQVPRIESLTFTVLTPVNCQTWCDTNMYAVAIIKTHATDTPCWVERSFDLHTWQRVSTVPIVGNGIQWEVGFYVKPDEPIAFYRLAL